MKAKAKISRKAFLKICGMFAAGVFASPFAGYGYSRYLEPRLIETKRVELVFPRLPKDFDGMRLVQFSDIHLDFHFGMERMESLVDKIQKLKPDMICFTGDLYDHDVGSEGEACARLLSRLVSPLGKWAVPGNHDYEADIAKVEPVLEKGGFSVLTNRSAIVNRNGASLRIAGVDDLVRGIPDLKKALLPPDADLFTILLSHAPDFADAVIRFPVDLQLSGHSHGGQVRLPFHGPLFTPQYAKKYPNGLYVLGNGKLHVYTNRGIGLSTFPIRFWCPPEITVFTLKSS